MDFHVKNKIITLDKDTLPPDGVVGDNAYYFANFFFDEEWEGKEKTARFIGKNGYKDMVLYKDWCYIPLEVMKSGLVLVGVYAGDLEATTAARLPVIASILNDDGLPADPTPDVYTQLRDMIIEIRDTNVSDEQISEAVRKFMEANSPITITTLTKSDIEGS